MERALIPRVGLSRCIRMQERWEKSEISARDLQKPFGELKNRTSLLHDKYYATNIEISWANILTPRIRYIIALPFYANCFELCKKWWVIRCPPFLAPVSPTQGGVEGGTGPSSLKSLLSSAPPLSLGFLLSFASSSSSSDNDKSDESKSEYDDDEGLSWI